MATLEEDIDRLTELDAFRVKAAQLRDSGRRELARSFDADIEDEWDTTSTPVLENSAVLKAILAHRLNRVDYPASLVTGLETLPLNSVLSDLPDSVPVLRAAKAMCALSAAPNSAFSPSVMFFYYAILRELYAADTPDWSTGGARGGNDMSPNTFVTWLCIRAIVGFQDALEHTATLIGGIASIAEQRNRDLSPLLPDRWEEVDAQRLMLEFSTTVATLRDNITLKLPALDEIAHVKDPEGVDRFVTVLHAQLDKEIRHRRDGFAQAVADVKAMRARERRRADADKRRRLARSASAHEAALQVLVEAVEYADRALKCFGQGGDAATQFRAVEKQFRDAARRMSSVLRPPTTYVSRVLDRELAAAASPSSAFAWDPAELAFAAVAYGNARRDWNDERLRRALEQLTTMISDRGRFPLGRPIHATQRGYQLHPHNADVIRAFVIVLRHVPGMEVDAAVVRRLMAYFQDTQHGTQAGRWYHDTARRGKPRRSVTAAAVLALHAINDMLDEHINALVYRHFSTKRPEDVSVPRLPGLFYSDYGLAAAREPVGNRRREPVAVLLERMRAHVSGIAPQGFENEPLFSVVLHGPPGTGKTTLVESLSRSCDVRLVEVTPSDIVIGGEDAIERRTRAVFKALSLLTRSVVLFDEFDPVLLKRAVEDRSPSVFSFLTPGMLPKLKTLHDAAAKRSVAYVLITNLIGKLDDAAIRDGRFDARLGVYPPDVLSREGQLYKAIAAYCEAQGRAGSPVEPPPAERVWEAVLATAGAPINTLAKPGWFTAPARVSAGERNLFARLFFPDGRELGPVAVEARLEMTAEPRGHARHELLEWIWVDLWDRSAAGCSSFEEAACEEPGWAAVEKRFREMRARFRARHGDERASVRMFPYGPARAVRPRFRSATFEKNEAAPPVPSADPVG